jgi:predicted DNA-binding transcriptional regulator AlpA
MAAGKFPRPVKVGRASRFVAAEVDAWIQARVADRDASVGA